MPYNSVWFYMAFFIGRSALLPVPKYTRKECKGMATVDTLEIQIQTSAESTNAALDRLAQRLSVVEKSLKNVGNTSNSSFNNMKKMESLFSAFSSTTNKSNTSISSLANSLGKMYLRVQMLKKGFGTLSDSLNNSIGYFENLNYFAKAFEQVAQKADYSSFEEMGYASAEEYAASFMKRANQLTAKMTGFSINTDGMLEDTGGVSLGLNPSDLITQQATFSQMASSMGTTSEQALKLSNVLTMLGADLASVKNMDFDKVWTDMQSGLAGMSRTMDKYGANIRLVNLQLLLNKLGIEQTVSALNQNEKALLRTIAILDATRYSWGDLSETLNQPANQIRVLTANFENLGRMIGNLFVPMISKALPYINGLVIALQRLVTWAGNFVGIDLSGITSSVGNVDISGILGTDEAEDGVNSVTNAVKKLKNTTLGIDELNINSSQEDSGGATGSVGIGGIDSGKLNDAFNSVADEYTQAWNNAFAQMENRSQQIADKIAGLFRPFTDIILEDLNNIQWETISKNLTDFSTAIAPYAENFGQGLLNFFEDMGDVSVDAINGLFGDSGAITNITEWLNENDPEKAEKWGYALGVLGTGLIGFSVVVPTLTKLTKGILAFANGIKSVVGFAGSAVTKIGLFAEAMASGLTVSESLAAVFGGSASTIAAVGTAIAGIGSIAVGAFAAIGSFVSMLTDKFSWLKEIIMVAGIALAAVGAIILGAPALVTGVIAGIVAALGTLVVVVKDNWSSITEFFTGIWEKITAIWETASGWFNNNVIVPLTTFFEGFKERICQVFEGLWIIVQAVWQVVSTWFNDNVIAPLVEFFTPIVEKISGFFSETWENIKEVWTTVYSWFSETIIAPVSEAFETACEKISGFFTSLWEGIKVGVATAMNAVIGVIESAINWIVDGINGILEGFNDVVEWGADVIGTEWSGVELVPKVTLGKIDIPAYEIGGYPKSASLFWANENGVPELVGNIGNQTAVASGTEITGISTAIYDTAQEEIALLREQNNLLMELLRKDMSVNIGDREIARANARGQRSLGYALIT